jgi:hypothetical protein
MGMISANNIILGGVAVIALGASVASSVLPNNRAQALVQDFSAAIDAHHGQLVVGDTVPGQAAFVDRQVMSIEQNDNGTVYTIGSPSGLKGQRGMCRESGTPGNTWSGAIVKHEPCNMDHLPTVTVSRNGGLNASL